MVTIEQYAREVRKMRELQRYYHTRKSILLASARSQERKVDEITNEILNTI